MADYHENDLQGTGSEPTNPRSRGELVDCLTTVTLIIEERLKFRILNDEQINDVTGGCKQEKVKTAKSNDVRGSTALIFPSVTHFQKLNFGSQPPSCGPVQKNF